MALFRYKVKDKTGKTQTGLVDAQNSREAANLLHEKNYYILDIRQGSGTSPAQLLLSINRNISFNDLVHFTRQISTMVTSGLTLIESLEILKRQITNRNLLNLVTSLEEDVQGGKYFADALSKYPHTFSPVYLALVRAGEASGKLDVILSRLADNLEKSKDFRSKIRGAMIYPSIIILAMVTVGILVITVVMPRMLVLFDEFEVELPLPTKILIFITKFTTKYGVLLLIALVLLVLGFIRFLKTNTGRHMSAKISLKFPVLGNIIKQGTLVEATRTLSILVNSGVPILSSLDIITRITGNVLFQEAFENTKRRVEKGARLADPLSEYSIFPAIFPEMVSVGEQTGKLGDSLDKLSKYFEMEAEAALHALTTIIEPLIMIILGVAVAFMVVAVLLPIYTLTSSF